MDWTFSRGVNSRNILEPSSRGFTTVALVYSPDDDITSPHFYNDANLRPLAGSLHDRIMELTVDVSYIRGLNAVDYCTPLQNAFANIVPQDNTYFMEAMADNPDKSNSYCGPPVLISGLQKSFLQTKSTKGKENDCQHGKNFQFINHKKLMVVNWRFELKSFHQLQGNTLICKTIWTLQLMIMRTPSLLAVVTRLDFQHRVDPNFEMQWIKTMNQKLEHQHHQL